jgi:hypothetical protein
LAVVAAAVVAAPGVVVAAVAAPGVVVAAVAAPGVVVAAVARAVGLAAAGAVVVRSGNQQTQSRTTWYGSRCTHPPVHNGPTVFPWQ